ncbi:hypothetical protein WA026_021690 [Henosepilachna vigintioctopunctata]|uniref:Uncharacterized protein n=1 Tax=Henosepilachna vigintioctopunctata TaxID=420089 RepID=A0AAW1UBB3_9CUCU
MSWLNFNDSLNNIKGQLSNFANTVLSEDKIEIQPTAREVTEPEARNDGKVSV